MKTFFRDFGMDIFHKCHLFLRKRMIINMLSNKKKKKCNESMSDVPTGGVIFWPPPKLYIWNFLEQMRHVGGMWCKNKCDVMMNGKLYVH